VIGTVGQVGKIGVLARLGGACTIAGALVAGIVFPAAGGVGLLSNAVSDSVNGVSTQLRAGQVPQMSTMVDAAGKPLAYFYDQRRTQVAANQISQAMKLAIVSVEDKRFYDNAGVDWRGTLRAALTNVGGGSTQGASTLTQQYVKNYELLVLARTPAQQQAATANTVARKVRDVRIALTLNQQLSKDEILARYLNLVPFGNGAYGVQQAAQTYFGVDAAALTVPQSAMLAGMVRSSSALNPYLHPTSVLTGATSYSTRCRPTGCSPRPRTPRPKPPHSPCWRSRTSPPTAASAQATADSSATTPCSTCRTPVSAWTRSTGAATPSRRPSTRPCKRRPGRASPARPRRPCRVSPT